jgi:hypothetical protein
MLPHQTLHQISCVRRIFLYNLLRYFTTQRDGKYQDSTCNITLREQVTAHNAARGSHSKPNYPARHYDLLTSPDPPFPLPIGLNKLRMSVTMTQRRIIARVINHLIATLYNTTKGPAANQIQKRSCTCNYAV